jgi:hypothetical protein
MIVDIARTGAARRCLRCLVLVSVTCSWSLPVARAAPAEVGQTPDLAAFDRGFRAGQEELERGEYLVAARSWTRAAGLLPESAEHKENRRAIHEYIAEAYAKAAEAGIDDETAREGLAALDAYAAGFAAAYAQESLPPLVEQVRTSFRARLEASERAAAEAARAAVVEAPPPEPAPVRPPSRPWKGLAIGGGLATAGGAAMVAMFAVNAAWSRSATAAFDDPAKMCDLDALAGECADIDARGRRTNATAIAGLVAAPLLLGAGIAMLVLAKRRKASNTALAPALGPGMAGLVWHQRF